MLNGLTFKVVDVDRMMADRWLNTKNVHNRPIYEKLVDTYANGMKHDEWHFNPQPIIFSDTDKLLDGQHHLAGVFP